MPGSSSQEQAGPPKSLTFLSTHPTLFVDPGRPSEHSPYRTLCVGFPSVNTVAVCSWDFRPLTLSRGCIKLRGVRSPLRAACCPVYASAMSFGRLIPEVCVPASQARWGRWNPFPNAEVFSLRRSLLKPALASSFITATLGTGGWLTLTRRGLSPRKKRQVSLAH